MIAQCRPLLESQRIYAQENRDDLLQAAQNARLVASAKRYDLIMFYGARRVGTGATRT